MSRLLQTLPRVNRAVLTLVSSLVLWGCAFSQSDGMRSFMLDYPSPRPGEADPIPEVLMIYRLLLEPSVDSYWLMVPGTDQSRQSKGVYRWRENPADMITNLTLRDLSKTGMFLRTVDQFSNARYRYAMEGTIRKIEGRIRDGKASALLSVDVTVIDFEAPLTGDKTLLKKTYQVEMASKDSSAQAIVDAMNLAIQEYSRRLRRDLRSVLEK